MYEKEKDTENDDDDERRVCFLFVCFSCCKHIHTMKILLLLNINLLISISLAFLSFNSITSHVLNILLYREIILYCLVYVYMYYHINVKKRNVMQKILLIRYSFEWRNILKGKSPEWNLCSECTLDSWIKRKKCSFFRI